MTLFKLDYDLFYLPFEKRACIPCTVWFDCTCYVRVDSFFVPVLLKSLGLAHR